MNARCPSLIGAALTLVFLSAAHAALTNVPPSRTVSPSGQFTALAPNAVQSSILCAFAEQVKHDWLDLLDLPDRWRDPVVIVLRERRPSETSAQPVLVDLFQADYMLKYEVSCLVPPPVDRLALGGALAQALCAEYANREQRPVRGTPYVSAPIPLWLSEGLAQSILGRTDLLLATARRTAAEGRSLLASDVMNATTLPAEPSHRDLYRANAWLLTEGLLRVPSGATKMQRYLAELGTTKSLSNAFVTVYGPDFSETVALEKWWSLERARRLTAVVAENLAAGETAARLNALLGTVLSGVTGSEGAPVTQQVPVVDLWRYYEKPWMGDVLRDKLAGLESLRIRAHPLYRPAIDKYLEALQLLAETKLSRCRRALAQANQLRLSADRQTTKIRDALDRAERQDAIREYLDQFDR